MSANRLVAELLLLQGRGRMTAEQLAEELEVSVRTVYRDVQALGAAGVPVYGEPGHDGGYRLVDGYQTRLTGLTAAEAETLFLVGLPGPAADLGLGDALAAVQLKLLAALPIGLRGHAGQLRQRFHLDTAGWYAEPEPTPELVGLVEAVWRQRRIRVDYRRWAAPQEAERILDPYGLVLKGGRWYLVAAGVTGVTGVHGVTGVRTYRVSQIRGVHELDKGFERPAGFDLADHWQRSVSDFDRRRMRGEAVVLLSPDTFDRLPDLLEPAAATSAATSAEPAGTEGWVRVVIPIESIEHARRQLLALGSGAEVVAPQELRERIAETVAALAATYLSS